MRNAAVQLGFLMIAITSVHAVKIMQSSSLQGTVNPVNGLEKVWAISGSDSISIKSIEGYFYVMLAPGRWKVLVNARTPYKSLLFDSLDVKKGQTLDLGKISLESEDQSAKTSNPIHSR
jgi:hypothetical protein